MNPVRLSELHKLTDKQLAAEIELREQMFKTQSKTPKGVSIYHELLFMYNHSSERQWRKQHKHELHHLRDIEKLP